MLHLHTYILYSSAVQGAAHCWLCYTRLCQMVSRRRIRLASVSIFKWRRSAITILPNSDLAAAQHTIRNTFSLLLLNTVLRGISFSPSEVTTLHWWHNSRVPRGGVRAASMLSQISDSWYSLDPEEATSLVSLCEDTQLYKRTRTRKRTHTHTCSFKNERLISTNIHTYS